MTTGKAVPADLKIQFLDSDSDKIHAEGGS
jgi:hypothetical protein